MSGIKGLLVDDYRPQTIEECILPKRMKLQFQEVAKGKEFKSLGYLFAGPKGIGKTSLATALCKEMGIDYIIINGSKDNGIDVLRTRIQDFASSISLTSDAAHKVVIIDEADYLNPNSTQPALRSFMEEFSKNCRFIFTCNYKHKIIEPLHSRCAVFDFSIPKEEIPELLKQIYMRVAAILKQNNIEFDKAVLGNFVAHHFPDFRRILNELQSYSACGKIDTGILRAVDSAQFGELAKLLAEKNFAKLRTWVGENPNLDQTAVYDKIYTSTSDILKPSSIPQAILILAEYQYKAAFSANAEINLVACLVELMSNCEFK